VLVTSFAFYPATFACEVSVSIDWALLSVYSSMSQTHRDDAGIVECGDALDCCASLHIVECGDALDCCASLQQSAEELAPTQLCASRGIWCVNCEDGVGASDQLLRIVDARADVGVRPRREQSTRTRVAFHQNIDSTGRCTLAGITATGVSPGAVSLRASTVTVISPGSPTLLVLRLAMRRFRVGKVRLFATCGAARVQR